MTAPARHVTTMSNAERHPLRNFRDHWQSRFSAQFPLRRTCKWANWPASLNERSAHSRLLGKAGPSFGGVCCLARATLRDNMFTHRRASIRRVTNCLGGSRLRWSRDRFVAQLFFGSNPVLDIFSVFAAALNIQLMSPASDLFSRWFFESNHGNLLGCLGQGQSLDNSL
jgi:hypothetical protein